jgi:hypothetical protein
MFKFTSISAAQSFRDRCDKIMMIVLMEDYVLVTSFATAMKYEASGYQVI